MKTNCRYCNQLHLNWFQLNPQQIPSNPTGKSQLISDPSKHRSKSEKWIKNKDQIVAATEMEAKLVQLCSSQVSGSNPRRNTPWLFSVSSCNGRAFFDNLCTIMRAGGAVRISSNSWLGWFKIYNHGRAQEIIRICFSWEFGFRVT